MRLDAWGVLTTRLAFVALLAFVASIPPEDAVTIPGVGSVSRALGGVTFALAVMASVRHDALHLRPLPPWLLLMGVYVAWNAATFFWSAEPSETLREIVTLGQLLLMAWLIWQLAPSRARLDGLHQAFVVGCVVMIVTVLATRLPAGDAGFRELGAFNANGFAILSALAIPMAWRLALHSGGSRWRWLNFGYPLLAVTAVVVAASRGGLLVTLVALSVIPLTLPSVGWARRIAAMVVVATGAYALFVWMPAVFPDIQRHYARLATTGDELQGGTLTGRVPIWMAGLDVFVEAPVVGVGAGTFDRVVGPALGAYKSSHNAYLAVATGAGLIGLTLFLGVLMASVWNALSSGPRERVPLLVLLAALLLAMAPANLQKDKFVWFVVASVATVRGGHPRTAVSAPRTAPPLLRFRSDGSDESHRI